MLNVTCGRRSLHRRLNIRNKKCENSKCDFSHYADGHKKEQNNKQRRKAALIMPAPKKSRKVANIYNDYEPTEWIMAYY